ncbi:hypothetical protein GCM10007103_23760 [Salinimicrobium marinum]|uniref:Uncharacterized protein n=1 Tax=Salinimicrobium marinum TaxID=680283 RepID=A0A918SIS2_9FLAO|nr:hypothetical protein [Salinimicrobium marinum]GHA41716.1 hypothetical protein GCM10007103_23760 [Salinimicrobium marinum]
MKKNKLPYHKDRNFKVPEGYFETLEDRIMQKVAGPEKNDILKGRKDAGFNVPENYFLNFENELFEKLENKKKTSKIISILNKEVFYYFAGAAAVFIAVVTTVFTNPVQQAGSIEDLDMVTLERYLFETMETNNSGVQFMNEEEAYAAPGGQPDVDFEALYDYLNENVEEPSILFNED